MIDHRQGNDLAVLWSIFKDGEPFDLRGRSLKLYLKNLHERKEVEDFSVTGNEIHWTFYGKDQDTLGKHSLILVANEDEKGMITTDACDFVRLVSCSCKLQGGEDAPNVETESIELTSTLEYVAGGGDYDDTALWNELENKVDKVEGLGLSEENYTTEEKEKLAGLENYDDSGIKGELAKKIESEVVIDTESTEDFEFGYDDTEIRQEIAELSAEVSGLSEKIESLPSAEDEILVVEYGKTTFQEVYDAYTSGKYIVLEYQNNVFHINRVTASDIYFISVNGTIVYRIGLNSSNNWYQNTYQNEQSTNKVTSLSESSTDTQYPSAKAVYDALQNVGGGSDVFVAVYGTTTYAEVKAAYESGKVVICNHSGYVFVLTRILDSELSFVANNVGYIHLLYVTRYDVWWQNYADVRHELKTLANGNAQITIAGKTAEVASGTPSGDPMHYMFEAVGATYNATDADIPMVGIYGDSYIHKAKHWHLNELGDITNEEMREIYIRGWMFSTAAYNSSLFKRFPQRTNITLSHITDSHSAANEFQFADKIVNISLNANGLACKANSYASAFQGCPEAKKILNVVYMKNAGSNISSMFNNCYVLEFVRLQALAGSVAFPDSKKLSNSSILYMIENEDAASAITITLSADAYDRAMADTEILAALEAHPNVSLASA